MKIPKFWARAEHDGFEAPGWSFTSQAEAQQVAAHRAAMLAEVLRGERSPEGRYLYGDRPVKEPVVETIGTDALVTRNGYGALCLNTNDVVFVDVDGEAASALDRVRRAQRQHGWGLRVYRTKAGLRIAATHARMSPTGPEIAQMFDAVGADPMYRTLCAMQESFRARLTPKPWRIGVPRIPATFPYRDAAAERAVAAWARDYEAASKGSAVCELVEDLGSAVGDPVIDRVLAFHDARVLSPGKPLA